MKDLVAKDGSALTGHLQLRRAEFVKPADVLRTSLGDRWQVFAISARKTASRAANSRVRVFDARHWQSILGDSQLLHELIKRRPADPEFHRGRRDFPAVAAKNLLNELSFRSFPRLLQSLWLSRTAWHACQFKVGGCNPSSVGHDNSPLHSILKFTDVAWPAMKSDGA